MSRRSGGFRGAKPTWTTTSTSGIFGMEDVVELKAAGQWPRGPVAPTSLAGTGGDGQVALTWTAPATTHGTITDYLVEYTAAGDPFFSSVSLLAPLDADTTSVVGGVTPTVSGTAMTISPSGGKYSGHATNTVATSTTTYATSFGNGDWTVECWIRRDALFSTNPRIIDLGAVELEPGTSSTINFYYRPTDVNFSSSTFLTTQGQWHHVAIVYQSGVLRSYVDGVQRGSLTQAVTPPTSVQLTNTCSFDDLRVTAAAVYPDGTTFTPPTSAHATSGSGSPTVVATGSTAASYTLTGLTNDTEYTFRVAAVNHTRGDWSSSVAVTPSSGPPSGLLFGWGYNASGQLGNGTNTGDTANSSQGTPLQSGSATWASLAASDDHSLGIQPDGTLWAWGANGSGQLGVGDKTDRNTPTQVGSASDWAQVSTGEYHTVAVKTDGTLWGWGHSGSGRLGDATSTDRTSPQQIGSATDWSQVACGGAFTLAIKSDGSLYAFGDNWKGQIGNGSSGNTQTSLYQISGSWLAVDAGYEHSMGIKSDGSLWGWGNGSNERLGTGNTSDRNTPTASLSGTWTSVRCSKGFAGAHTAAIRNDQSLWVFGNNGTASVSPTQISGSWAKMALGKAHTLAIKDDGSLWAWGEAVFYNQVGDGQNTNRETPVQIGSATTWLAVAGGRGHSLGIKA